VLSDGGDFVDDVESADGGVAVSFEDLEPDAVSDGFESAFLDSESFESDPFSPVRT
jgi:hypothetical protein